MTKMIKMNVEKACDILKTPRKKTPFWIFMLKIVVVLALVCWGSIYVVKFLGIASEKITEKYQIYSNTFRENFGLIEYRTKLIPADQANLKDLVENYSKKYSVSPAVTWSLIDIESAGNPSRIRFEQTWKTQYGKKHPKPAWMNDIEYDLLFSSYGLMQVGFLIHADRCGLDSFVDLFDPAVNLDCGLSYLAQCLDKRQDVKEKGKRLWMCLRDYNGKGPLAEKYADKVMARLADYLINESDAIH